MALTLSGTNGVVGAGFTVDASGVSVTAGVGTFGSLAAPAAGLTGALPAISAANLTNLPAANITGTLPAISGANLTNLPVLYSSYAILADIKSAGTAGGGTLTSGDWRTRDLNTEISDPDGIVSISSNQFTLQAGTYRILANVPAYQTNRHQAALYNITDTEYTQFGSTEYIGTGDNTQSISILRSQFSISGATVFEIRHRGQVTETTYGMGVGLGDYWSGSSMFMVLEIFKEA